MSYTLLSIITPVYNVASFLDRCIRSILSQSYHEIELILIDDGSTDGSGAKCDEWARRDKRIIVLHKQNGGVSSARNEGLTHATGDFITFVDPDDFVAPDTYKPNMEYLISHAEVDVLQYPYCRYAGGQEVSDLHMPPARTIVGQKDIFTAWWSGSPLEYVVWNKIFRRRLWHGVRFAVGHVSEDTILVPQFVAKAEVVFISTSGLYCYQQYRKDSYTFEYDFHKHLDLFYAHAAIYDCFKSYPDMATERVLAFTRMFRRLIVARLADGTADIQAPLLLVQQQFPSWRDILLSRHTEKLWLYAAKLLGARRFTKVFVYYLNLKAKK